MAVALKGIDEVREIWEVYGSYDIMTKVEAETVEELKETVVSEIRRLDYVRSTLTMIAVK